jgi:ABC-type nitrate/sulfonate/bicarbonate transport system permease component
LRILVLVVGSLVWELICRAGYIDRLFLVPPSEIVQRTRVLITRSDIHAAFAITAYEIIVAFVLAAGVAIPLGLLIGLKTKIYELFNPIILILFAIPQVTIYYLFVLWFGIGVASKIAFGFTHGFFPIILNTIAGVRGVDPSLLLASRSMGASRLQLFSKVIVPWMLPTLITGLRLGMNFTLLGVFLAELVVSQKGLGTLILVLTSSFETASLYSLVGLICVLAIVINESLRMLEKRLGRWRPATSG